MSKLGRSVAWAVVAAVALYLFLGGVYTDGRAVVAGFLAFPPSLLLVGLALAALNYAIRFLKWQYYLRRLSIPIRLGDSASIFLSGFALTVTPGKIGEVLKSYLLRESYGIPVSRSAPIILAERLTDLISLLLLSLLGASVWMTAEQRYLIAIGFVLCAGLLFGLMWRRLGHRTLDLLAVLPPRRVTATLVPRLRTFYDAAHALLRPQPLLLAVALSTLAWFCECLAFFFVVRGAAASVSLLLCVFIYALMTVAGALAFVPGGLGVTEGGMALLLVSLGGVARPTAVAATLIIRVLTLWFAVLLGVSALLSFGRRRRLQVNLDTLKDEKQQSSAA
jgi:uncharacterized protein (TIRG00374 family)